MATSKGAWLAAFLLGCGASAPAPMQEPVLEGCEYVLVDDKPDLPLCNSEQRCEQIAMNPDERTSFGVQLSEYLLDQQGQKVPVPDAIQEHRVSCVARQAQALGLDVRWTSPGSDWVQVEGSYADVEPLLQLDVVFRYSIDCSQKLGNCAHCAALDEKACSADPFCQTKDGYLYDSEAECMERTFAGCTSGEGVCSGAPVTATSPDGRCWGFGDTCVPDGFSTIQVGQVECGPGDETACSE